MRNGWAGRVCGRDGISGCCSSGTSRVCRRSGGLRGGWRMAESAVVSGPGRDGGPPDHSTLSRTRRRIDEETHGAVFTWVLEPVAEANLVSGEDDRHRCDDVGGERGDAEHRASGHGRIARGVREEAGGGVGNCDADAARFDRSRKDKTTSNKEWRAPQDPDAKMKDGRTHKVEHGVDMDTGAIVAVTVQDASAGDTATLPETLTKASEQVEAVQPDGREVEEVVADKSITATRRWLRWRSWRSAATFRSRSGDRAAGRTSGRARRRRRNGLRSTRCMGTAAVREGLGGVDCNGGVESWWSGRSPISTRPGVCGGCGCAIRRTCASACSSKAAGCNLGLLLRRLTGIGTLRSLQRRALSAFFGWAGS